MKTMETVSPKIVLLALLLMSDLMCQQIEILEGDNVSLKPKRKENVNEVTWTLEHNKVAEMNINGKVTFFRNFEGRAQLNTITGEMIVSTVQLKDSGTYRCELIDNNDVISETQIVLLVHPRLEAPQISCILEDTAVLLGCETSSSSEHVAYNWNFHPCTTNSDDCELKNNNEMITIRNARSYISQEVYCTVSNSLHSNRSESFLIRNCMTDLRDRLFSESLLFSAANAVLVGSFLVLIWRFFQLRNRLWLWLLYFLVVAGAAVTLVSFLLLMWRYENFSHQLQWTLLLLAGATVAVVSFLVLIWRALNLRKILWLFATAATAIGCIILMTRYMKLSQHLWLLVFLFTADAFLVIFLGLVWRFLSVKELEKSDEKDTQESGLTVIQESNMKESDMLVAKETQETVDNVSEESDANELDESVAKETQEKVHTVPEESVSPSTSSSCSTSS